MIENNSDYSEYIELQDKMKEQVIKVDELPKNIRYVAGVDVAYNEDKQLMVGAVVVLNIETLEVIDEAFHIMKIKFPYVPGLFSFREIPAIKEAYFKLQIKPDIIVCDAQGIAHPKGIGMATHLGIELDKPTIGCAKKKLIGVYNKEELGNIKGSYKFLKLDNNIIGAVLRTQTDIKPMFVSIGHKVSLNTAIELLNKLTPHYRLPETTRMADQLVNSIIKEV
ncbi:endonuclease V [Tenacibaculum sp. KUL113]|nr:endonuclease V [Tenacibaculum sp. KUL113]